jgi:predicted AAA+ superfamily ATPase
MGTLCAERDHGEATSREILYWREKRGHEVDFILTERRTNPIALECKWSDSDFDATNLQAFRRQYPEGENLVVAHDVDRQFSRKYAGLTIRFENLPALVRMIGPNSSD